MNFKKFILFALLSCGAIAFHKPAKAVSPANNVAIYFAAGLDHSPNSMNNLESQKEYVDELKSMGVTPEKRFVNDGQYLEIATEIGTTGCFICPLNGERSTTWKVPSMPFVRVNGALIELSSRDFGYRNEIKSKLNYHQPARNYVRIQKWFKAAGEE